MLGRFLPCVSKIGFVVFVNHVYLKALMDVEEVAIDLLQPLIVFLERFQQDRLGPEERSRYYDVAHRLQDSPPGGEPRSSVRRAKEDDSIC